MFNQRKHKEWCDRREDLVLALQNAVYQSIARHWAETITIAMPCDRDTLLDLLEDIGPGGCEVEWLENTNGYLEVWYAGKPDWMLHVILSDDQET